jgi:hypothetical protein
MSWAAKEHGLAKQNALAEQLFEGYHCKVRHLPVIELAMVCTSSSVQCLFRCLITCATHRQLQLARHL